MHLEVLVGAVAKKLRAARPKVGAPGDVLLGRRGGCLVQVDRGHACPLSLPETRDSESSFDYSGRYCSYWVLYLGGDELLSAVDVIGCAREGGVGHNVHGAATSAGPTTRPMGSVVRSWL